MMKLLIVACICAVVSVACEGPPAPPPKPDAPGRIQHSRVARQALPGPPDMQSLPGFPGGNPGNLAMQGLGNFPDPTAVIGKVQEMGKQMMGGRRRRQAGPLSGQSN